MNSQEENKKQKQEKVSLNLCGDKYLYLIHLKCDEVWKDKAEDPEIIMGSSAFLNHYFIYEGNEYTTIDEIDTFMIDTLTDIIQQFWDFSYIKIYPRKYTDELSFLSIVVSNNVKKYKYRLHIYYHIFPLFSISNNNITNILNNLHLYIKFLDKK